MPSNLPADTRASNQQTVFPPLWFVAMLKDAEDEHRYLLTAKANPSRTLNAAYLDDARMGVEWAMVLMKKTPPTRGEAFASYVARLKSVIERQAQDDPWANDPSAAAPWRAGVDRIWRLAVCGHEARREASSDDH